MSGSVGESSGPGSVGESSGPSSKTVDRAAAWLKAHAEDACDETFFQCGAVDLAVSLIGQYLYFHESKTAVRILETEAYPADDEVYELKFRDKTIDVKPLFKLKGGVLLSWSPTQTAPKEIEDLYVTAGAEASGDCVHIRSCEPILGLETIRNRRQNPTSPSIKKNLLIGPLNVSEGIGTEWQNDPLLYKSVPSGVQLFCATTDVKTEKIKRGKRILSPSIFKGHEGFDSPFRFALATPNNYNYSTKSEDLHVWEV